jgi:hypothetical protein
MPENGSGHFLVPSTADQHSTPMPTKLTISGNIQKNLIRLYAMIFAIENVQSWQSYSEHVPHALAARP